jgi:hypothetical protein
MKRANWFSRLKAILIAGFMADLSSCSSDKSNSGNNLPVACSVFEMSPRDRELQLKRINMVSKASDRFKINDEGFSFVVNLNIMPETELEIWMQTEQKCCSFLRLRLEKIEMNEVAKIQATCLKNMTKDVMSTFGNRKDGK